MIIIGLGANLPSEYGDVKVTLDKAIDVLGESGAKITAKSNFYLTEPVPVSDQPWYHNLVVSIETDLGCFELLGLLQNIENKFGRVRTIRNAPRVIDLDLICYNHEIIDSPELIVPHPRMSKRAFVLFPMDEIASDWLHPIYNKNVKTMKSELCDDQNIKILEG